MIKDELQRSRLICQNRIMKSKTLIYLLLATIACLLVACHSNPVPRPRGYYRIDLPEKHYKNLVQHYPFSFLYPEYAVISKYKGSTIPGENTENWLNIDFPRFRAHLYLTYKPVEESLGKLIEDSHAFVYKHIVKADAINQEEFISPETSVFGVLFDIKGNTATALQFYITDSVSNFLRGALYFDCEPNRDSLAPLVDFLREDIEVLMESFTWI